jgi:quercetin dioxygenase-like cupin family protein
MFTRSHERRVEEILPGIQQRTLGTTPTMMMCEARLRHGSRVPPHRHPHEQITYIVSGKVRVCIDGQEASLQSGDVYAIAGNREHEIDVLEDTVVVDVFSPHRAEYRLQEES